MMYWFPLVVIIYTYTSILLEIRRRSKKSEDGTEKFMLKKSFRNKIFSLFIFFFKNLKNNK